MGNRGFILSFTISFLVFLLFLPAGSFAEQVLIYDNSDTDPCNYYFVPVDWGFTEVLDYGTSGGGKITRFTFGYVTTSPNPGTITIRFYRGTDWNTSPGTKLKTFNFSGLSGSGLHTKTYDIPPENQFNLASGDFGYSYEFADSFTGVLLASGGTGTEDAFWGYDDWEGVWYWSWFGGSPWAGFYMQLYTGTDVPDPNTCIIEGYKFDDTNADGDWDGTEPGLSDWEIYLDINDNDARDSGEPNAMTDSNGYYRFVNINADTGPYTVAEVMKPGWSQTMPGGAGTYLIDPDPNGVYKNINFGNNDTPLPITISGYVGVIPFSYGLKDVVVSASTGESTTTDIFGYYELTFPNPWTGTITPSKGDWTFSPSSRNYAGVTVSIDYVNFTAIEPAIKYWGGSGTEADPYQIRTAEQLQELGSNSYDWDKHFELIESISLSAYTGEEFNMIGLYNQSIFQIPFTGTFNGKNNSISSFTYTYNSTNQEYIGIFCQVDGGAGIKDLRILYPEVNGGEYGVSVGTLVGEMKNGTVTNCSVKNGSVTGDNFHAGGLIGRVNNGGSVTNCSASIDVSCIDGSAGGLVGDNSGTISNCKAEGAVMGLYDIGGLVGDNHTDGIIEFCQANTNATGDQQVGGLVGENRGIVRQSSSAGTIGVTGAFQQEIGGLVGRNIDGQIEDCYSTADVTGGSICGGLVGVNWSTSGPTTITNCYATGQVSGTSTLGGLVGWNIDGTIVDCFFDIDTGGPDNGLGTPLSTALMQTETTFTDAGWDFTIPVWDICDGTNYPRLSWQELLPADFLCPEGVDLSDFAVLAKEWLLTLLAADIAPAGGDGFVDYLDWAIFADAWLSNPISPNWNPACDIAPPGGDDVINILDILVFTEQWLKAGIHMADIAPTGIDGVVDYLDWAIFADAWLSNPISPNWNPACDIAPPGGDDVINILDISVFAEQWLKTGINPADIAPSGVDGKVNALDLLEFSSYWLEGTGL